MDYEQIISKLFKIHDNLGQLLAETDEFEKAIEEYKKCFNYTNKDLHKMANINLQISNLYGYMKDKELEIEYFQKSLKYFQDFYKNEKKKLDSHKELLNDLEINLKELKAVKDEKVEELKEEEKVVTKFGFDFDEKNFEGKINVLKGKKRSREEMNENDENKKQKKF
jgi:tetratricopeptide (TPR) repeat protein